MLEHYTMVLGNKDQKDFPHMEQGMVNVPICEIIILDVFVFRSEIIQNNSLFYTILNDRLSKYVLWMENMAFDRVIAYL
jgi:hypothetical protein